MPHAHFPLSQVTLTLERCQLTQIYAKKPTEHVHGICTVGSRHDQLYAAFYIPCLTSSNIPSQRSQITLCTQRAKSTTSRAWVLGQPVDSGLASRSNIFQ